MALLITEEGDFVGIIGSNSHMLYVGNVGCHPIVVTNEFVFLNSDGSTFIQISEDLLKQSGDNVRQFIVKKGKNS